MTINDLDNAPCGFLVFNDEGKITDVNQTLVDQLAYVREDLVGKSLESIFNIAGRIFYQTHFFPLIRMHGHAEEIFFMLRGKDGSEFPVICNALRKQQNGLYYNHCILFNAVQRGKYEEQLLLARQKAERALQENAELTAAKLQVEKNAVELDRRISQLIGMNTDAAQFGKIISHDMQETIRKIGLYADKLSLENSAGLGEVAVGELNRINMECRKMRALAVQLETYISLNDVPGSFEQVDLNVFFEKISEGQIIKGQLPVIKGNKEQLSTLFSELLQNAVQFRNPEKPLVVRVNSVTIKQNSFKEIKGKYRYIDFVQLTIADNGRGFEMDHPEGIFSIRRKESGGLLKLSFGLAFAKKIVDNHFGFISLHSIPNEGTTVTVHLPVGEGG